MCRLFYWVIVPIIVLYLALNIFLNSIWTRGKIGSLLERKTGVEWHLGTLHVLPNGVLCIYDIESTIKDGGLTIEAITVELVMRELLGRRIVLRELEIIRPTLDLSEQDLIALLELKVKQKIEISQEPLVADNTNTSDEDASDSGEVAAAAAPSSIDSEVAEARPTSRKIEVKPSGDLVIPEVSETERGRDAWIKVIDGKLRLRLGEDEVAHLEGFSAEIPIQGKDAKGNVQWGEVTVAGRRIIDEGEFFVHKVNHVLSVKQTDVSLFGLDLKPELLLVRGGRSGLLFQADLEVPQQSALELMTHLNLTVGMAVESLEGRMRLVGDLFHPLSWQALGVVDAKNIEVAEGHSGGSSRFDSFQFQSALQRGVLQVPHCQLLGEEVSLMSNGVLTMNGYGFGVCRLVAAGEKVDWINKMQGGAQMIQGARGSLMQPFETQDVKYMDVEVDGSLLQPLVRVANVSDWQPLWEVVGRVRRFIKNERNEELTTNQR